MTLDKSSRQKLRSLSADALHEHQLRRLNQLLEQILPANAFYRQKLQGAPHQLDRLEQLAQLPFTTKDELLGDDAMGLARHLTYAPERYVRYHRTSGSRGKPLAILDTNEDWKWWIGVWQYVFDAAGLEAGDRVAMAFSFGPFIGFWSAYDAAIARGALVVPTGGMSSLARLELIRSLGIHVVFCTPTYALHLASLARQAGIDLGKSSVRLLVVAGEPGGSIPAVRGQLESAWGARVHDHCGATEIGPWGFGDSGDHGLIVNEAEFIPEFLPVARPDGTPSGDGQDRELVLTNLGRIGAPILRYRTGDVVRPAASPAKENCPWTFLEGGILGRVDDMIIVRGVNIYPSGIEQMIREFPEVDEFRLIVRKKGALDHLTVEVEDRAGDALRIAQQFQPRLGLNVDVINVPPGSLPRSEHKAARFVDQRRDSVSKS
jgi:phenylacetate-CoA ligase